MLCHKALLYDYENRSYSDFSTYRSKAPCNMAQIYLILTIMPVHNL